MRNPITKMIFFYNTKTPEDRDMRYAVFVPEFTFSDINPISRQWFLSGFHISACYIFAVGDTVLQ
jgi:hypothetical protein